MTFLALFQANSRQIPSHSQVCLKSITGKFQVIPVSFLAKYQKEMDTSVIVCHIQSVDWRWHHFGGAGGPACIFNCSYTICRLKVTSFWRCWRNCVCLSLLLYNLQIEGDIILEVLKELSIFVIVLIQSASWRWHHFGGAGGTVCACNCSLYTMCRISFLTSFDSMLIQS